MLHFLNLEEIRGQLLRLPALIRGLKERDPQFVAAAGEWLEQIEKTLANNRLAAAASVATCRGILISAGRGVIPADLQLTGRATTRKVELAVAVQILRKAEELVSSAIQADSARFAEAELLMRQVLSTAQRKGIIPAYANGAFPPGYLAACWQTMSSDSDLAAATVHLNALVGLNDVLILLDRAFSDLAWSSG